MTWSVWMEMHDDAGGWSRVAWGLPRVQAERVARELPCAMAMPDGDDE